MSAALSNHGIEGENNRTKFTKAIIREATGGQPGLKQAWFSGMCWCFGITIPMTSSPAEDWL